MKKSLLFLPTRRLVGGLWVYVLGDGSFGLSGDGPWDITVTGGPLAGTYELEAADYASGPAVLAGSYQTGTVEEGEVLTANPGLAVSPRDPEEGGPLSWTFQWFRGETVLTTGEEHTVTADDLTLGLSLRWSVTNALGTTVSETVVVASNPLLAMIGANVGGVYDPQIISSLWKDTTGADPVTADGDLVARIDDISGNSAHLSQVDSARRPVFKTDGTRNWLEFDGTDDYLLQSSATPWAENYTAIAAVRPSSISGTRAIITADETGFRKAQFLRTNGAPFQSIAFLGSGSAITNSGASAVAGSDYVVTSAANATNVEVFANRVSSGATATGSALAMPSAKISLGAIMIGGPVSFYAGRFYAGAVVGATVSYSDAEDYLASVTGITLP